MPGITSLFSTAERGGGTPKELYTIRRGASTWRYTDADRTQTVSGLDYLPTTIKRASLDQKNDKSGTECAVSFPLATAVGQALLIPSPFPVTVSIQRTQSSGTPILSVLAGSVVGTKLSDDRMELTVATIERAFKTLIPKVVVQRGCPKALYSPACGVDKDLFAHETTIDTISGQVITLSSMMDTSDGFYNNGMIVLSDGRPIFIAKQVGLACTIWQAVPDDVSDGDTVTVYPGCNKTFTDCETKFDNAKNYGGFPNLPNRNPALQAMS